MLDVLLESSYYIAAIRATHHSSFPLFAQRRIFALLDLHKDSFEKNAFSVASPLFKRAEICAL